MSSPSGHYHLTLLERSTEPQVAKEAGDGSDAGLLRVGDLARMAGKTVRAIHHYEELGLIEPAGRSKGHYRLFEPDALARIRWIGKLQSLGLSLAEIRTLVRSRQASPSAHKSADQLRRIYEAKLVDVRARMQELAALERELEASVAYLDSCVTSCTPEWVPTACAQCARHPETAEPDLISGALG